MSRFRIGGPVLSEDQRAFIRADTMIDRQVVDRCVRAFTALVEHDDLDTYKAEMMSVSFMIGSDAPRPTAMDVMKTIIVRAYADQWRCPIPRARARLLLMMKEDDR